MQHSAVNARHLVPTQETEGLIREIREFRSHEIIQQALASDEALASPELKQYAGEANRLYRRVNDAAKHMVDMCLQHAPWRVSENLNTL